MQLCTQRHAMPGNTTPRHATPRHATPHHATPRHTAPRHATLHTHVHTRIHEHTCACMHVRSRARMNARPHTQDKTGAILPVNVTADMAVEELKKQILEATGVCQSPVLHTVSPHDCVSLWQSMRLRQLIHETMRCIVQTYITCWRMHTLYVIRRYRPACFAVIDYDYC